MILAFGAPTTENGIDYYEFAPEEQTVYDENGEPTGTETTYLKVPATQLLFHEELLIDGETKRVVTYHPSPRNRARVEACPEWKARDWAHFHDKYLKEYRQCRLITSLKVDGEGNLVQETLDDYILGGDNPVEIQSGHMKGGGYLGIPDEG